MKIYFIAIALLVIALMSILVILQKRKEGFEDAAPIPVATQTSSIPTDVAGATTTNPSSSLAQPTDIQALSDSFNTLKMLIGTKDPASTDLDDATKNTLKTIQANTPGIENKLKTSYTNPDITGMTVQAASETRQQYDDLTSKLRNANIVSGPIATVPAQNMGTDSNQVAYIAAMSQPTLVANPPQKITLDDLKKLKERINQESLNLANTRSTAATTQARKNQLEDLAGNLTDTISRIERGTLAIDDVPITKEDAENFLHALQTNQDILPSLKMPSGTTKTMTKANTAISPLDQIPSPVKDLLNQAQKLKWNVQLNVSYDPNDQNKNAAMTRLDKLETTLNQLAISKIEAPNHYLNSMGDELNGLQKTLQPQQPPRGKGPVTMQSDKQFGTSPDFPSANNLDTAQDSGMPEGSISPDVYIRPGFAMNDEQIQRRASASAFDPTTVGGPDWKERALNLCKQVGGANLGDPTSFGCITNADEVGPYYSWKGNYTMVCNRLGDTWGAWYPEMLGCPKYNPQQKFSMSA